MITNIIINTIILIIINIIFVIINVIRGESEPGRLVLDNVIIIITIIIIIIITIIITSIIIIICIKIRQEDATVLPSVMLIPSFA